MTKFKTKILSAILIAGIGASLSGCYKVVVQKPASESSQTNKAKTRITKTLTEKTFNKIDINVSDLDVEIRKSNKAEVLYKGVKDSRINAKVIGQTLKITDAKKSGVYVEEEPKIIVYVPKKLTSLTVKNSDGDLDIDDLKVGQMIVDLADGDVSARKLVADSGKLSSSDGDVDILDLASKTGFSISSADGDISVSQNNATGYYLTTTDGDLDFKGKRVSSFDSGTVKKKINSRNVLHISTADGDIRVN